MSLKVILHTFFSFFSTGKVIIFKGKLNYIKALLCEQDHQGFLKNGKVHYYNERFFLNICANNQNNNASVENNNFTLMIHEDPHRHLLQLQCNVSDISTIYYNVVLV